MNMKKLILGGIAGGVAYFLLGWLVWGKLLMSFMMNHSNPTASIIFRSESEMVWWAMIAGNMALGFVISYILIKANISSTGAAAMLGAVVGLLFTAGIDSIMYAQMKIWGLPAIAVDVIASCVVAAIVSSVVATVQGMGNKS